MRPIRFLGRLFLLGLVLGGCAPSRSEFAFTVNDNLQGSAAIAAHADGGTLVLDITSPGGVGTARITRAGGAWPEKIRVRLHYGAARPFRTLEGFFAQAQNPDAADASPQSVVAEIHRRPEGVEGEIRPDAAAQTLPCLEIRWVDAYR